MKYFTIPCPRVINVDDNPSYPKVVAELKREGLVQSLNLGPIWQASDSLSPRVPGSARRPFLKFAPEPAGEPQLLSEEVSAVECMTEVG